MPELANDLHFSEKVQNLKPSGIRIFDNKVSKIPGIIKLTLGEPDLNTPEHVKQAAIESIENNDSHYAPQKGKKELLEAISNFLAQKIQVKYDPESEIVATVGATEAINAAIFTLLNPEDKILVPTPVFSLYWPVANLAGVQYSLVNTAVDNFKLTAEKLETTLKTEPNIKAIILNYPTNPTGVEYTKEEIKQLVQIIRKYHLYVITDEIYSSLTYGVDHYSIATEIPERALYISGLSKSHAMTGYRLGYIAGPKKVMEQVSKVHGLMVTTTTDSSQAAAIEALNNGYEDVEKYRKIYEKRRKFVFNELTNLGFDVVNPQGAFYIFAKIPAQFGKDDLTFARKLAHEAKVGVIPGNAFGPGGEGYIRLSYAAADSVIDTAIERLQNFMNNLR